MSTTTGKTDAVTGWWRSLSLRAKVTGVAVSILALGLIATGIGTTVFLRSQLLASVDTQVSQLAGAGVSALFDIDLLADPAFVPKAESVPTDYFVAIYNQDGDFIASAGGGRQSNEPDFPTEYLPTETSITQQQEPFTIPGTIPGTEFRAASALIEVKGTTVFYTQMIAVPLTTVTQTLATYLGIYSILSVITIVLGAVAAVVGFVMATLAFGAFLSFLFGRRLAFGLLAGGSVAICGASAALAIASVLPPRSDREQDTLFVVIGVTALSTIAMIAYPVVFRALGMSDLESGFLIGATIHDVAQVVGAGYSVSEEAGVIATFVKTVRVALSPVVIIVVMASFRGAQSQRVTIP